MQCKAPLGPLASSAEQGHRVVTLNAVSVTFSETILWPAALPGVSHHTVGPPSPTGARGLFEVSLLPALSSELAVRDTQLLP